MTGIGHNYDAHQVVVIPWEKYSYTNIYFLAHIFC